MKKIGFGIIGTGMIADFHAKAIMSMENVELVAIYGRNKATLKSMKEKYPNVNCLNDLDNFLKINTIDIITVATPSGVHCESIIQCAKAKKHIICEKPLEVTLEKIDEMIQVCKDNQVILSGIFPRRFNQATHLFKEAIDNGRFGTITLADAYVKWYRTQDYYDSGNWRGTWELDGGGALMNQSIHTIDLLLYLMGDIKSICAFASRSAHQRIEVEDIAVAILEFSNGAKGVIEGSTACYSKLGHPAEIQICGSKGSVFMQDNQFTIWDFENQKEEDNNVIKNYMKSQNSVGVGAADPKAIDFSGHKYNFQNVVDHIRGNGKLSITAQSGRKSVEIILAIYQSALNGGEKN